MNLEVDWLAEKNTEDGSIDFVAELYIPNS